MPVGTLNLSRKAKHTGLWWCKTDSNPRVAAVATDTGAEKNKLLGYNSTVVQVLAQLFCLSSLP